MLRLRDDLVLHIIDVALNRDVFRLTCDFCSRAVCALSLGAIRSSWRRYSQGRLKCDNWADWSVVSEPWMVADVVQLHTLLRVRLQELRDEVLCYAAEPSRPLNPLV